MCSGAPGGSGVIEGRHQDTICCMGKSELDHRGETVNEVSLNVRESSFSFFSLKVSAEVSKLNCNPSVRKTRTTQVTVQGVYDPTPTLL